VLLRLRSQHLTRAIDSMKVVLGKQDVQVKLYVDAVPDCVVVLYMEFQTQSLAIVTSCHVIVITKWSAASQCDSRIDVQGVRFEEVKAQRVAETADLPQTQKNVFHPVPHRSCTPSESSSVHT
jgi:hypothetical protein